MAGHSKWAQIKHKKAKVDQKRGKIFSKLIREITVAAREGGGDPELNPRLRLAIERAKAQNMPWDNIERAIKRATGEMDGVKYEQVVYEGYGPGGVAFMVVALTDNRNRTANEIRHIFSKHGGNLSNPGSVAWQFTERGVIFVDRQSLDEDALLEIVLEAGAEDLISHPDAYEIRTAPDAFSAVRQALEEAGVAMTHAELTRIPQNTVQVEGRDAERVLKLMEALEDHDDVQQVFSNFDISEETMQALAQA